jgi:hypothetical protein
MLQWSDGYGDGVDVRLPEATEVPEPECSSDGSGDSRVPAVLDGSGCPEAAFGVCRAGAAGGNASDLGGVGVASGVGLGIVCMTVVTRSVQTAGLVLPVAAHAVRPRMPVAPIASATGAKRHAPTRSLAPGD